ncbi:dolichyl-P-Glc:Glc1Man9GlcNAc2-PP-dolichol alpha-1,3-glucosyltransferase [Malassezia caprae]|uniref:Alpha-1,3-glucosyltransferase n=1 Tax=Malassezia caprae TaxID=1381934 RepID=A0AAF0EAU7_9BASI|nr:dolichyl-P-Glc:Glc1Man9GlcNAc2-PP-dolichol alpha-1,3-glucosyltransferase [Malassezia caprae]
MDAPAQTAVALGTALKVLLWPAYHSTDMEVHRNWLAITHQLPLRDWYIEATSPWTLDYPPFFAYLSYILAVPAAWFDANIVRVDALNYDAWSCVAYMRATVLVTEGVLALALALLLPTSTHDSALRVLLVSVLLHPGLVIVDHIHFQYNGFLFGVLFLALWAARTGRPVLAALAFSSLLQLKHLFVYIAPAWTVYLLRSYLLPVWPTSAVAWSALLDRTIKLGAATLAPFALSIVPFVLSAVHGDVAPSAVLHAMYERLFPFHRGLMHAYWAPNVWALYAAADRVLLRLQGRVLASASRGKVGDTVFGVLPTISPGVCFTLALGAILVYMVPLWRTPSFRHLVVAIVLCALTSFAVGWHVHEKAVLLAALPLSLVASHSYAYWRTFQLLTATAIVTLFPLLFTHRETPIKLLYGYLWYTLLVRLLQRRILRPMPTNLGEIVHWLESQYLRGLAVLALGTNVVWPLVSALRPQWAPQHIAFLPLLLTSVYGAAGIVYVWVRLSVLYLWDTDST